MIYYGYFYIFTIHAHPRAYVVIERKKNVRCVIKKSKCFLNKLSVTYIFYETSNDNNIQVWLAKFCSKTLEYLFKSGSNAIRPLLTHNYRCYRTIFKSKLKVNNKVVSSLRWRNYCHLKVTITLFSIFVFRNTHWRSFEGQIFQTHFNKNVDVCEIYIYHIILKIRRKERTIYVAKKN